jgi:plasmid stability protein
MPGIAIQEIDEATKARLQTLAESHGRSLEEEAREILKSAVVAETLNGRDLAESIRRRLEPVGGFDLKLDPRQPMSERTHLGANTNEL